MNRCVEYSRFLLGILINLSAFPIWHRPFLRFPKSPLSCLSPPFFLGPVQLFTPDANNSDAQISIELLYRVEESLIAGWQQYVGRVLGMECEAIGDCDRIRRRVGHMVRTPHYSVQANDTGKYPPPSQPESQGVTTDNSKKESSYVIQVHSP